MDDDEQLLEIAGQLRAALKDWNSPQWPSQQQWSRELGQAGLYARASAFAPHSYWAEQLGYQPLLPGQRPTSRLEWTDERISQQLAVMFDARAELGLKPWPGFTEWQAGHDINLYYACARSRPGGVRWWKRESSIRQQEAVAKFAQ